MVTTLHAHPEEPPGLTVDFIISWKGLGSPQASDFVHRLPPISFGSFHHPPHHGKETQLDHAPFEGWKDAHRAHADLQDPGPNAPGRTGWTSRPNR